MQAMQNFALGNKNIINAKALKIGTWFQMMLLCVISVYVIYTYV